MTSEAERYRNVAAQFTQRVEAVPPGAWDYDTPCEGWVARDVVGHLAEWLPAFFFDRWDLDAPTIPSVRDDPVGAWTTLDRALQAALDDRSVADAERETPLGRATFATCIGQICTPDVLVHTWDLARATGQDETLDADEVRRLLEGIEPMDEPMRQSGHYGPKVPVADDADDQTKLIAFMGRDPGRTA